MVPRSPRSARLLGLGWLVLLAGVVQLDAQLLPVPHRAQVGHQWCWAASSDMVHDFCRPGLAIEMRPKSASD